MFLRSLASLPLPKCTSNSSAATAPPHATGVAVGPLVRWSIRQHESKSGKMSVFENFVRMFECEWKIGVWMGVGCPCPPVHNNLVTLRHLYDGVLYLT